MLVKIKTLKQLEKEFDYDEYGSIKCYQTFPKAMNHLCGNVVEIKENRFGFEGQFEYYDSVNDINWCITHDMIDKWMLSEQDKIDLMKNLGV